MTKKSKGKILNRIFEESENGTHTSEELDGKLEQLGVNPDLLVKKGLQLIEEILKKVEKPLEENELKLDSFLLAAKRENLDFDMDKEINKIKNKKNK